MRRITDPSGPITPAGIAFATAGQAVVSLDRRAARALVWFGASGLVIAAALALALLVVAGPLAADAAALDHQRAEAVAALQAASTTMAATATTVEGATASLADAQSALRDAAAATNQLADAAAGLGALSATLAETASRTRSLSDELSRTADAVTRNEADGQAVAAQVRALAAQVDDLATSLDAEAGGLGWIVGPGSTLLLVIALALVGWLGTAAAACLWLGRRLVRAESAVRTGGRPAAGPA